MARVTVVGGTLVDVLMQLSKRFLQRQTENGSLVLPFGSKIESSDYIIAPGGSGANVAAGLQKLGLETTCFTGLSQDTMGRYLEEQLAETGVKFETDYYPDSTSLSVVLRLGIDRTIITTHHDTYGYLAKPLPETGWLHLGPLPPSQPIFYQKLLAHVIKTDQSYSLNPSMAAIDERERYFLSVIRSAAVLFVNYEEGLRLGRLSGKPDPKDMIIALLRLGPKVVCVTCGGKGAYVGSEDGILFAKALQNDDPEEMDTTGAGDAFTSGFLALYIDTELDGTDKLERALKYGIINSAAVVTSPGAQSGLLSSKQVEEDLSVVTVKKV